jgi:hypothetical protein
VLEHPEETAMRPFLLFALVGALLAGCAMPQSSSGDAMRDLQSTQPDRSAEK